MIDWRPTFAFARQDAANTPRGQRIALSLASMGVPVVEDDRPHRDVLNDVGVASHPASARSALFIESLPYRGLRQEAFPNVVTRAEHFFGTTAFNCPYRCSYCYLY